MDDPKSFCFYELIWSSMNLLLNGGVPSVFILLCGIHFSSSIPFLKVYFLTSAKSLSHRWTCINILRKSPACIPTNSSNSLWEKTLRLIDHSVISNITNRSLFSPLSSIIRLDPEKCSRSIRYAHSNCGGVINQKVEICLPLLQFWRPTRTHILMKVSHPDRRMNYSSRALSSALH